MLAVLLCLTMVLSLIPMVSAAEELPLANEDEVVIYYTNDVHTYIDKDLSYDNVAWLKDATEEQAAGVLLLDAGDHVQGTAYGSMDKGETIIKLMNAAGYDAATLGNHEFDYGMERALELVDMAEYPYLSCNFHHEKDGVAGESVLDGYKIFEVGGMKIAVIGVTTPESFTKSTPAYFQDENGNYIYGISGGSDGAGLYTAVQNTIEKVKEEGADVIIGLGHLGDDPASRPWTSEELIANTDGLDAFIDGHSHTTNSGRMVKDHAGNDVVLTQTGEYFSAIGRMVISEDGIETGLITVKADEEAGTVTVYLNGEETGWEISSDETTASIKDAWLADVDQQLGEVIGHADVTFNNYDGDTRLVRKMETNTGDFAADALYYLFEDMGLDVDVAIMNGGGVRNKAITGDLTYKTMKDIHTFGNVACLQTVTGQQILDALEWGARETDADECGGFLQVSGLTYEIHTYIKSTVQKDDKGVWTGGPTGEYRVKNVKILQDGKWVDLDLKANYNLAGYNYTLRDLGDGFAMFGGAVNVLDYVMEDYQVLANYVKSFPVDEATGLPTITAENSPYGEVTGEGRITLVKEEEPDPTEPTEPDPKPVENPFKDVKKTDYFYDSVLWAVEHQITAGTGKDTFSPNAACTRAQIVTFLYKASGEPEVKTTKNPFTDVKETDYYYKAVLWAYENGVTTGMTKTTFGPSVTCTRAHAVTFLSKAVDGKASKDAKNPFKDVAKNDYYYDAALWAVENGITAGTGKDTFSPNMTCTRAQIVTFLYKAFN